MKKVIIKFIYSILIFLTCFIVFSSTVKATSITDLENKLDETTGTTTSGTTTSTGGTTSSGTSGSTSNWLDVDSTFKSKSDDVTGLDTAESEVGKIMGNSIAILQVIGVGIAIFMLMALGMKYMMASVEERAKIKEHAVIYVLGALVFFSAAGILKIIQVFIQNNFVVS